MNAEIYNERIGWILAKRLFELNIPQISEFYWDIDTDYEEVAPEDFKENPDWCDGYIKHKSKFKLDDNGIPTGIGKGINGIYSAFTEDELVKAISSMRAKV